MENHPRQRMLFASFVLLQFVEQLKNLIYMKKLFFVFVILGGLLMQAQGLSIKTLAKIQVDVINSNTQFIDSVYLADVGKFPLLENSTEAKEELMRIEAFEKTRILDYYYHFFDQYRQAKGHRCSKCGGGQIIELTKRQELWRDSLMQYAFVLDFRKWIAKNYLKENLALTSKDRIKIKT